MFKRYKEFAPDIEFGFLSNLFKHRWYSSANTPENLASELANMVTVVVTVGVPSVTSCECSLLSDRVLFAE